MAIVANLAREKLLTTARSLPAAPQVLSELGELLQDVNTGLEEISSLLKRDAAFVVVGNLDVVDGVDNSKLAFRRQSVAGSLIGNLKETQEVLDFCAANGIAPEIEIVDIKDINEVYTRVENGEDAPLLRPVH